MKNNSSAASPMFKYGSFYFPEQGGFNSTHSGPSTLKTFHESNGMTLGRAYKNLYEHSKKSDHKRVNSPTRGGSYNSYHGETFDHCSSSSANGNLWYKEIAHSPGHSYNMQSGGAHSKNYGRSKSNSLFKINERETMQFLNERLASYLEKVRTLEQGNGQMERRISEWYENNAPSALPDSSQFLKTIEEVQKKIFAATVENANIALQIDNSKWATDDFSNKYEIEVRLRNNVGADVKGLQGILEVLHKEKLDLEFQVQELQEEVQEMKKNHEEEVNSLRGQLGARVSVELDAAPSIDLNSVLSDIREEYENLMERNLRDVEAMFLARTEELGCQVEPGSENQQSVQIEIIDLKRSVQNLEIDLQSQLNMNLALQDNLTETEANYSSELAQLQRMINNAESELAQVRCDLERQNIEYKILMDQKNLLETEIATYKHLLEGQDSCVNKADSIASDITTSTDPEGSNPTECHPAVKHSSEASC
ncbi:PREDICTED: keratin, type I cytoskeletal 19-like [Nanorana parkeri]|uniref:keratin, type I cytoskeletal 19-like n=1 Tax=Nanorana parkeri TaxID=125878 RepID=UPI00085440FB|nr:PREDICTED: keratin, type I cytoskeletal 19-like [Nanorana parkeri]